MRAQNVLEQLKKDKIVLVQLQFTDLLGVVRSITIPVKQVKMALDSGVWFDGSSIKGFSKIFESDLYLKPDVSTYSIVPWLSNGFGVARFICDIYNPDSTPFEGDPRYILKKVLNEAKSLGFDFKTGPELEFFLFKNGEDISNIPQDEGDYFSSITDGAFDVRSDILKNLGVVGIEVEAAHHEVAFGQQEINFRYDNALRTADNTVTMKFVVKAVSKSHDLLATFIPKPISGINGSGMHVHQSLFDLVGKNLFYNPNNEYFLSDLAYNFIAGQLKHVREMSLILSPLVNSYKRLVPGYEAPVYICWGKTNRSSLIRLPRFPPNNSKGARFELRCPDPSSNPYLVFAVLLKAGLEGVKKNLKPNKPLNENLFNLTDDERKARGIETLPGSLGEAITEFEGSALMRSVLGSHVFSKLLEIKKKEWDEYRLNVSKWELEKYLKEY